MTKFIVEKEFWDVFPDAKIGILICTGIDNNIKNEDEYKELIGLAEKEAFKYFTEPEFSKNPVIKVWREGFQKFKTKKGARSSIEALLKRVNGGNHIGSINPLVDIYNSISLKYGMPCGGEDIDTFDGDIKLTKALGSEEFIPLGENKNSSPYEGEIVYKDNAGAICRCFNWRESYRTMLTENTVNSFMCIEMIDETRYLDLEKALDELSNNISVNLGGKIEKHIIHINNSQVIIEK